MIEFCDVNYYVTFCLVFANFFRLNEFIYEYQNYYKDQNFEQFHVIKRFIIFGTNSFILRLLVFKIDFFCVSVDIFIAAIRDVDYFVTSF